MDVCTRLKLLDKTEILHSDVAALNQIFRTVISCIQNAVDMSHEQKVIEQ